MAQNLGGQQGQTGQTAGTARRRTTGGKGLTPAQRIRNRSTAAAGAGALNYERGLSEGFAAGVKHMQNRGRIR